MMLAASAVSSRFSALPPWQAQPAASRTARALEPGVDARNLQMKGALMRPAANMGHSYSVARRYPGQEASGP